MITAVAAAILMAPQAYAPKGPVLQVVVASRGTFEITTDRKNSPLTVKHIVALVNKGFYNGQRVHRVEPWVTQWGAPASRTKPLTDSDVTGGGSGKDIPKFEMCEVDFMRGVVGIASGGLQTAGDSQIFILKKDTMRLYHSYAVLGKVTKGMNVVDRIKKGDRIVKIAVKTVEVRKVL